jgi:L-fuculose-phosphate aldolase
MNKEIKHRQDIVRFGKLLHERGYVAATDGNLSVRLDSKSILATPTCISKGTMRSQDLVVVEMHGRKVAGRRNVSSEIAMHLLIYKMRPSVNAVVHAHPPVATGYAAAGIPLNPALVCEAAMGLGVVPLAPYATPGTPELADVLCSFIPQHEAILMANHGVVTYGEDLPRAYMKMELVEHFARIALVTRLLGHEQLLTPEQLEELAAARQKYEFVGVPMQH